ncbi:DUF4007 family protein [Mucilaginibacter sp. PAMB04168]|uniref:DUF4007 family protein n=1 Tax=Mucilaginibacter sp. PAMB04168 TaxID=3138567 RepID=UPI0031F63981
MLGNTLRLSFSGHDSFQCRQQWLKKGYDHRLAGRTFQEEDAVVHLGVGKNMVGAIRYWMKAFDLIDQADELTLFAHHLFADNGWDPYLEDQASLWLLHYHLIKKASASSYHLVFNELRKEKVEFSRSNFVAFVKRRAEAAAVLVNDKTVADDFGVMLKMYLRTEAQQKEIEDSFSGIFTELDLIKPRGKRGEDIFAVESTERNEIPDAILLYTIADQLRGGQSVNLVNIEQDAGQAGTVFALNRSGITSKIERLVKANPDLVYSDHAGVRELQFRRPLQPFDILNHYYAS